MRNKYWFLLWILALTFTLININTADAKSNVSMNAYFGRKSFDVHVKDTEGHTHHIHGWIEYSLFPPAITHGDIWFDDTHIIFSAKVENPNGLDDYNIEGGEGLSKEDILLAYDTMEDQIE